MDTGTIDIMDTTGTDYDFREDCAFYCVSYNNPVRASIMVSRFASLDISLNVHSGVQMEDHRLSYTEDAGTRRLWSCCYGHLDNLAKFYATGKKYGFLCEDDVHIHKDLAKKIPSILLDFEKMGLDILLLGYMTTFPIAEWMEGYTLAMHRDDNRGHQYHEYPENQWGIHLALISRSYAARILDTFAYGYAKRTLTDQTLTPFNPDWTITKLSSKRALLYPMLAVEDGKGHYDHWGQGNFHRMSHAANYIPDMFF